MRTALEGQSDFRVSDPTSVLSCRSSFTRMKLNFLSDLRGDADSACTISTLGFDLRTGGSPSLTRELSVKVTVKRDTTHAIALWMAE